MRRLLILLAAPALALPMVSSPAAASTLQSCGPVKIAGVPQPLATKVKVKNLTCADAKMLWTSYASSGEPLPGALGDLSASCRDDSKAARKKAAKAKRLAIICRSGKTVTKAWVLGG
jgi:hypothetical protein